jgi:hypothetical protein
MSCLDELALFKLNAHWSETLSITSAMPVIENENDDIKREAAFQQVTLLTILSNPIF